MNNVRFYFSNNLKLANMEVLLGTNNEVVATGNLVGHFTRIPRVTICGIFDPTVSLYRFSFSISPAYSVLFSDPSSPKIKSTQTSKSSVETADQ